DVVNCILARLGLAPTCGVGNVDEMVAKVRFLAAKRLQTRSDAVRVYLVAHHAMSGPVFDEAHAEVPPFFLRVEHHDTDVTEQVRADDLLVDRFPIPSGPATHFLTAASTLRLLRALMSDS